MSIEEDRLRSAWQEGDGAKAISARELRQRIERLARRTRVRNVGGFAACALVLLSCVWWLTLVSDTVARTGAIMTVIGTSVLLWQLFIVRHGEHAATRRLAALGGMPTQAFHRAELERQRDFHRGWRLWFRMLALTPGPLVFMAGFARVNPRAAHMLTWEAAVVLVLAAIAIPLNLTLARRYQRQLQELDS